MVTRDTTWDMEIDGVRVAQIDCTVEWGMGDHGEPEVCGIIIPGWRDPSDEIGTVTVMLTEGRDFAWISRQILDQTDWGDFAQISTELGGDPE